MANTKIPSELVAINAISGTLIADNAITAVHVAQNQIHSVQLAINSVTALQIADGTITSAKIADGTIVTADIADGQITTGKLADSSVTTAKIAAGTILGGDIANNAILTQHIDDNQITADQIADNAVGVDQLAGIARGKIIVGNAAGNPSLLALGAANTLLQSDGTDLVFAPLQSGIDDNSNAVAITIDSSEQVGIGITAPIAPLTINNNLASASNNTDIFVKNPGTAYTNGDPHIYNAAPDGILVTADSSRTDGPDKMGLVLYNDNNTAGGFSPMLLFAKRETGSTPFRATMAGIYAKAPTGTGNSDAWIDGQLHFATAGAATEGIKSRMVIDKDGNVGIGTSSPTRTFEVNSGATNVAARFESTDSRSVVEFKDPSGTVELGGIGSEVYFAPAGVEKVRIDSSGNVGIKTTDPDHDLHIESADPTIVLAQSGSLNNANSGRILFAESPSYTTVDAHFEIKYDGVENHLYFGSPLDQTTDLFVVGRDGNVGIGETTPLGKLHIKEQDSGQGSVNANFDQLVLEDDSHSGMTILSGTSGDGGIYFGDSGGNNMGQFKYKHATNAFEFTTNNGSPSFTIDINGTLQQATSSTSPVSANFVTGNSNCDITLKSANSATLTRLRNGTNNFQIITHGDHTFTQDTAGWDLYKNGSDAGLTLKSASTRSGIFIKTPGTNTITGSVLVLANGNYQLGTASHYHIRMEQDGDTYMGNSGDTHFTEIGVLSVMSTTSNAGISSGKDIRALGPSFANDANSITMSQEPSGAYFSARGNSGSEYGNIKIGVANSGGAGFKAGVTISPTGVTTTSLNPAFRARAKSAQAYSSGWQKVLYDESVTTRGTGYASSRFTAPVAGWYQFNAQWTANNNADVDGTFSFWINGSSSDLAASVSMPNTGANYDGHSIAGCCYLDVNHYVEAYRYANVATTTRSSNPYGGWFSGFLIG